MSRITAGLLGQGIGNADGFAMDARPERGLFHPDADGASLLDHNVYAICSDGDITKSTCGRVIAAGAGAKAGSSP